MAKVSYQEPQGTFFTVLGSTGNFHQKVDEGTPGAKYREYETSDGNKGGKWELTARSIEGEIEMVSFYDGDFGTNILIYFTLEEGEEEQDRMIVSLATSTPFGEQFMEKLPHINKGDVVKLTPYSFEDENGKSRRGITIVLNGSQEKLDSFYQAYDAENKKWLSKEGFPTPEGDTSKFKSDDWKLYFLQKKKYLMAEVQNHVLFQEEMKDLLAEQSSANAQANADFDSIGKDAPASTPPSQPEGEFSPEGTAPVAAKSTPPAA